jgi:uncharacterized protein (DUF2384 family)
MSMPLRAHIRSYGEEGDAVVSEIAEVIRFPESWLETPNDMLGGQAPQAFLSTAAGREVLVNLARAIKYGMMT